MRTVARSVGAGANVIAVHMRPPLRQGHTMTVHITGSVPLTNDEIKQVSAWIEEIADEYRAAAIGMMDQFHIDPPWKDEFDQNTHVRRYRRYSCAGFVIDGHRQVSIDLLDIAPGSLPEVDRQTILATYADAQASPIFLAQCGLGGNGPYRIVLPGYVLHSMKRTTAQIRQGPYRVQPGDERF